MGKEEERTDKESSRSPRELEADLRCPYGARFYYRYRKFIKTLKIYLMMAGPGIIVMVADNDAGGITTYSVTGATIRLQPDMVPHPARSDRLLRAGDDRATWARSPKRGHAEAIFDAFGSFWGWFSLSDLALTDWLTLITEFIGMTAALSIFGIPPVITVVDGIHLHDLAGDQRQVLDLGKDRAGAVRAQPDLYPRGLPGASGCLTGAQGVVPNIPGGPTGGTVLPAHGEHRHDHRSLDAVLPAILRG